MELPTKLLLVMLIVFGGLLLSSAAPPPTFTVKLEVSEQQPTSATYLEFMTNLNEVIRRNANKWIRDHPVLGKQKPNKKPAFWVHVEVTDAKGHGFLTLALRSDNLYVSGFRNQHDEWFAFKSEQETLPGSTELSYTGSYPDIFGKDVGYLGLRSVQVNRTEALANALLLANYRSDPKANDTALKPALAFFILTIPEAERFPSIRDTLADAMDAPTPETISGERVELVVNWAKLSCALLAWDLGKESMDVWNHNSEAREVSRKIGVNTPDDALRTIQPLLRGRRCTGWPKPAPALVCVE